jgi:hypothetical protein
MLSIPFRGKPILVPVSGYDTLASDIGSGQASDQLPVRTHKGTSASRFTPAPAGFRPFAERASALHNS